MTISDETITGRGAMVAMRRTDRRARERSPVVPSRTRRVPIERRRYGAEVVLSHGHARAARTG